MLRPGGRFGLAITHPTRWMFPDDPTEEGPHGLPLLLGPHALLEVDDVTGARSHVEHHRTLGDWVHLFGGAGFRLTTLLEPQWPATTTDPRAAGRGCAER